MIALRKKHEALGHGRLEWHPLDSNAIAAYSRQDGRDRLLIVNNLSGAEQSAELETSERTFTDVLRGRSFSAANGRLQVDLQPYEYLWLQA
jgi:glycosidase